MTIFNSYVKLPEGSCVYVYQRLKTASETSPVFRSKIPWENPPETRLAVRVQGVGPAFAASQVNEADLAVLLGELPMDWKNAEVSAVLKRPNMGNIVISPRKVRKKKNEKMAGSGRQARSGSNPQDFPIVSSQTKGRFLFVCASTKSGT